MQVIGTLLGFWHLQGGMGILGDSLESWVNVSPELILVIFLPALIFGSAMAVDYHVFSREIPQMLVLAVPGVALASIMTALFAIYAMPFGWGWNEGLAFGAMLSATDPVAVVRALCGAGAPLKRCQRHETQAMHSGPLLLCTGGPAP